MITNDTYNILSYRQDVLTPFFSHVRSGESCFIVGAPSVGKTRLMDFLMGDFIDEEKTVDAQKIKEQYLNPELAKRVWFVRVDMNRLSLETDWTFGFFELLLSALLATSVRQRAQESILQELGDLDSECIESKDALKAHRFFEMAVSKLCHIYSIKICMLFDEFDETYKSMPASAFSQLRAVRDANKYNLFYALFLRNLPDKIRSPKQNESFYELLSRNMVGLGPYNKLDSIHIIQQMEKRREHPLLSEQRQWIYQLSGGHPGLIQALFSILKENLGTSANIANLEWVAKQEIVFEEFRKIWNGLLDEEKESLHTISTATAEKLAPNIEKLLKAKGLVKEPSLFFSPLLGHCLPLLYTHTPEY
ncbi:MAG: hypothetical protein CVU44_04305 [Chloroflexi bacterium HGW-Chloroflexi-6]|nr:MAG: hypothetical protein CVU44_04305 [Chloroflexi bacterium HGW-Chloroflexi-6]